MSDPRQPLAVLRDFVERSTHWREGGADRHAALKEALPALEDALDAARDQATITANWRKSALSAGQQAAASRATASIAIGHLQAVLNKACTYDDQQRADTAARDWLISIGSEPT